MCKVYKRIVFSGKIIVENDEANLLDKICKIWYNGSSGAAARAGSAQSLEGEEFLARLLKNARAKSEIM